MGFDLQGKASAGAAAGRPGTAGIPGRWAAAAGVVAVAAGVVVGELVAALVSPALSPMTAVGGAVIDAVPPAVKDWAVAVFGTADKLALLVGMGLAIAALAALAGLLEWRRRFAGFAVIAVFGVVGLVAVLGRAQVTGNAIALATACRRNRNPGAALADVATPGLDDVGNGGGASRAGRRTGRGTGRRPHRPTSPGPTGAGSSRHWAGEPSSRPLAESWLQGCAERPPVSVKSGANLPCRPLLPRPRRFRPGLS